MEGRKGQKACRKKGARKHTPHEGDLPGSLGKRESFPGGGGRMRGRISLKKKIH